MSLIKNNYIIAIGAILGFGAGYLYWHFYGCTNGCTISSVWWRSSIYGSLMGGLIFSTVNDYIKNGKL